MQDANNVLSFDRPGHFYSRKAMKYAENDQFFMALDYARKAVEHDDHPDYQLDLAEIYSEMGCYEDSNFILFELVRKEQLIPECYFNIGCNFLGMHEFAAAHSAFSRYLEMERAGLFEADEDHLNEVLESQEMLEELLSMEDDLETQKLMKTIEEAKLMLESGKYRKAARMLERMLEHDPSLVMVRTNLAMSYFYMQEPEKAIAMAQSALEISPKDVHAHCNLAIFYQAAGNTQQMQEHIDFLEGCKPEYFDDIYKVGVTFCEMGMHKHAYSLLKSANRMTPYDERIMHFTALNASNIGLYNEAIRIWGNMLIIRPQNSIASFYRQFAIAAHKHELPARVFTYMHQVPYEEILRRIRFLNDLFRMDHHEVVRLWVQDGELAALLVWGMELSDPMIKRMIIRLLGSLKDIQAETILRHFLLKKSSEDVKRDAMAALKEMDAPEPYLTLMGSDILEVRVTMLKRESDIAFNMMLENAQRVIARGHDESFAQEAVRSWRQWMTEGKINGIDEVRWRKANNGWCAAIEMLYAEKVGIFIEKKQLLKRHRTTAATLRSCLLVLNEIIQENSDEWRDQ